jgi:uncharacterized metal-binding protein YceD (DUF177 family)
MTVRAGRSVIIVRTFVNIEKMVKKNASIGEKSSNFALQSVDMSKLEQFKIDLQALKEGVTDIHFDIDDSFFEAVAGDGVQHGNLVCDVTIDRNADVFDLDFHTEGSVTVQCERCLDDMDQPIASDYHLVAQFGDDYSEDDDLITVPENEGILDTAWFIYQFIELAIPLRHVHAPGKCNPAMMKILEEHSAARSGDGDGETPVDSRWAALAQLKNKK